MNSVTAAFPGESFTSSSTTQHPQENEHWLKAHPMCNFIHADKRILAQSGRGMVLDLAGAVT